MKGIYFVSGIDTNIGKTYATGLLAKELSEKGVKVITQKMIQTGNKGYSEDIEAHRQLMGIGLQKEDKDGLTAPCIFSYPCSPHLAASLDGRNIDLQAITDATRLLSEKYEVVLLEGAGGLMVPITEDYLTIDYVEEHAYPVIFVTSGRLGSLNHTLLNLEIIKNRKIRLAKVIYNLYPESDPVILRDSLEFIRRKLEKDFPLTPLEIIGCIK